MRTFFILFICAALFSCTGSDEAAKSTTCFSFDQRSCAGDPWNEDQKRTDMDRLKEKAEKYLKANGIDVVSMKIDPNFHTVVCLACEVCPDGPRYYVSINAEDSDKLEKLNLLSLEQATDCK